MIKTIYVANTAEAFGDQLEAVNMTEEGKTWIRHELALSQRALLWGSDHKAVITSHPIPQALLEHNIRVVGYSEVIALAPALLGVNLSSAILQDCTLLDTIAEMARLNTTLNLSPYAITGSFVQLVNTLNQQGTKVTLGEMARTPKFA